MFKSPAYNVKAVKIDKVIANNYNLNKIASPEMKLLYESIKNDGYTMPIVCYYDKKKDKYIIVDGFHRYTIMKQYKDIYKRENGKLPISVIDRDLGDRMASTVRHNRARGNADVDLMSDIIAELIEMGRDERWISKHLGMSSDEILRLKQVTGLASLFKDSNFSKSWEGDKIREY